MPDTSFRTVLIANRGEIACRIIRTLRAEGIRSIAVYSDADRDALHARLADVSVRIGPAPAPRSYLNIAAIVAAARETGAEAIHPGYGFLSENADFARACTQAGIVFIGPSVDAIDVMGDKIRAKHHVSAHGVPIIRGVGEPGQSDADLIAAADDVGFPLLIKPSAGGGGKGMTVVESATDLPEALAGARRVARTAFGDDTLLLERYLSRPRHIEVQVLADAHDTVIHLGERECSLQRRHQKIVEESPSPLLTPEARERMGRAACEVARSVDYRGAGTVEFLVSADAPDEFFFMEMNTRLQVEHPVTEQVTGLDLVALQLRIAAGLPLGLEQEDVSITGHAIEARLYAEDPASGFLPSTGRVIALREARGDGIRVDSSLIEGLEIGASYDPMLAKIIATGTDREDALAKLDAALAETVVLGLRTNRDFLATLLRDPAVRSGELDTGLIARFLETVAWEAPSHELLATLARRRLPAPDGSVWSTVPGWRLGEHRVPTAFVVVDGGEPVSVEVADQPTPLDPSDVVAEQGDTTWVATRTAIHQLDFPSRERRLSRHRATLDRVDGAASPEVRTPMPGTVVAVAVASGAEVTAGDLLVTIEAMKMEHRMLSPISGVVTIDVGQGDQVSLDQVVARVALRDTEPHPQGAQP